MLDDACSVTCASSLMPVGHSALTTSAAALDDLTDLLLGTDRLSMQQQQQQQSRRRSENEDDLGALFCYIVLFFSFMQE